MKWAKTFAICAMLLATALAVEPVYMYGKAILAQQLLQYAWQQNQEKHQKATNNHHDIAPALPWYWADTYPVAKLTYIKKATKQTSWIIVAGMSGRTMAFGPAWLQDSAKPNQYGNTVISAHNDSHFSALAEIAIDDEFLLESVTGEILSYQVSQLIVVDENDNSAYQFSDQTLLTLITCYPFTSSASSIYQQNNQAKTQRLIVQAVAI